MMKKVQIWMIFSLLTLIMILAIWKRKEMQESPLSELPYLTGISQPQKLVMDFAPLIGKDEHAIDKSAISR